MTRYTLVTASGLFSIEGDNFKPVQLGDKLMQVDIVRNTGEVKDGMPAGQQRIASFTRVLAVYPEGQAVFTSMEGIN